MNRKQVKWFLLVGVVLIALLRMYKLPYPNFENTAYEMFDNPATARNFVRDGLNPLTPRHDAGAEGSCYNIKVGSKYFTYPYIVLLLYFIFGVHEIIGRIVTLLFSLGTTFLIFKLGDKYFNRLIGIIAAVIFNILPLTIHTGQTWLRYHFYVFFLVLTYYLFLKWIEGEKDYHLLLSSASGAIAFLTNPPGMYMALPILYLCFKKFKWEFIKKWQLYLFALISITPVISWWIYGNKVFSAPPLITDLKEMAAYLGFDAENPPKTALVWRELTNPEYYFQWAKFDFIGRLISTLSKNALTPVGIILLIVGLFIKRQEQYRYQFHFWVLAFLIYCFIDSRMVYTADGLHHHHYIEFTPVACLFIASGGKYIWDSLKENTKWDLKVVAFLVVILYFVNFFTYLRGWIEPGVNMTAYRAAKAVEKKTPEDAVLLTENGVHTAVIYYSNRTGWPMNIIDKTLMDYSGMDKYDKKDYGEQHEISDFIEENYHTPKLIDFFIKKGATHYVITNFYSDGMKSKLKDYVIENFEIVDETNEYIISDLRKRIN